MSQVADSAHAAATSWFADQMTAAACAENDQDRQVAMVERSAPAGSMPPLHRRDEAETYRMVAGSVTFFVGCEIVAAGPGDVVVAPAGAARTFRVESEEGARWLVLTRLSSLERFLDIGRAVARPGAGAPRDAWPSAAEHAAVGAIAAVNGIELLGPPGALPA